MTTRHFVLDAGRHAIQVLAFCCVVAVLTQTIWPQEAYSTHLVKSLSIGLVIWLVIEFGRLLVPQRHCYPGSDGGHGWPRGWRGGLLAAVGTSGGLLVGAPLGDWLTGTGQLASLRDRQVGLLITIAAGAVATYYFYARGRAAALEAGKAAAERDASQARLMLLQSQLEPHMLFNTLANLRALIGVDPAAAQAMLDRLNDYLRATLAASRATQHPLAAEFDRLADYLALMAVRMGPRLGYVLQLPDDLRATLAASRATQHPLAAEFDRLADYLALMAVRMGPRLGYALQLPDDLRALPVPTLLLQPLVENALRHGLDPRLEGGRIEVSAARQGPRLRLAVRDTGVGFDPARAPDASRFGLTQVRERVATAYGGRGQVSVQTAPGAGCTVSIELPLEPIP